MNQLGKLRQWSTFGLHLRGNFLRIPFGKIGEALGKIRGISNTPLRIFNLWEMKRKNLRNHHPEPSLWRRIAIKVGSGRFFVQVAGNPTSLGFWRVPGFFFSIDTVNLTWTPIYVKVAWPLVDPIHHQLSGRMEKSPCQVARMAVPIKPPPFMRDEKTHAVADTKQTCLWLLVFWIHNKSGKKKKNSFGMGWKSWKKIGIYLWNSWQRNCNTHRFYTIPNLWLVNLPSPFRYPRPRNSRPSDQGLLTIDFP